MVGITTTSTLEIKTTKIVYTTSGTTFDSSEVAGMQKGSIEAKKMEFAGKEKCETTRNVS